MQHQSQDTPASKSEEEGATFAKSVWIWKKAALPDAFGCFAAGTAPNKTISDIPPGTLPHWSIAGGTVLRSCKQPPRSEPRNEVICWAKHNWTKFRK